MEAPLQRLGIACVLVWALCAASAAAQPAAGPRETVDEAFTTTQPGAPTGLSYSGVYHAAGKADGAPPYMRRMVFYPPPGMRYDTTVPDRCTAPDAELEVMGPDACPPGSRLGRGTTEGLFYEPIGHAFLIDHFQHTLDVLNGDNEQILLVKSEGYTVVRGHMRPDGSTEFAPPTCFPAPPAGQCADDYVLQLKSATVLAPYTKTSGGQVRSYATTPPTCPSGGSWSSTIKFWWADGSVDSVVSRQPCPSRGAARRKRARAGGSRRSRSPAARHRP